MTTADNRMSPQATSDDATFMKELVALIPFLRAFARTLCGDRDRADDLCQETLAKAWQSRASFQAGTNFKAWLFMILRNNFYSERRRAWRQRPWNDTMAEQLHVTPESQNAALNLQDVNRALGRLRDEQREALILVGAGGFSCEEAAKICGCAVGTIKSRVNRARTAIIEYLDGRSLEPLAPRTHGQGAVDEILEQLDSLAPGAHRLESGG
jgi:RNA polymerase sigma-70 factor, ECF subfamily